MLAVTVFLMARHYSGSSDEATKVTTNGGKESYCSNDKFFGFNMIMMLLLINKLLGKPKNTNQRRALWITIFGYLCLNVIIFVHLGRGVYLVYGDHKDNGAQIIASSDKAT